jgi:hypothetical protein
VSPPSLLGQRYCCDIAWPHVSKLHAVSTTPIASATRRPPRCSLARIHPHNGQGDEPDPRVRPRLPNATRPAVVPPRTRRSPPCPPALWETVQALLVHCVGVCSSHCCPVACCRARVGCHASSPHTGSYSRGREAWSKRCLSPLCTACDGVQWCVEVTLGPPASLPSANEGRHHTKCLDNTPSMPAHVPRVAYHVRPTACALCLRPVFMGCVRIDQYSDRYPGRQKTSLGMHVVAVHRPSLSRTPLQPHPGCPPASLPTSLSHGLPTQRRLPPHVNTNDPTALPQSHTTYRSRPPHPPHEAGADATRGPPSLPCARPRV